MNSFKKDKKGISGVIVTVLMVLLTLSAVAILAAVIIPFVRDNMEKSQSCLEVIGEVSLVVDGTCYNGTDTKVKVRIGNVKVDELYISIGDEDSMESYNIINGTSTPGVNEDKEVLLPISGGGQKTYFFDFEAKEVQIGAVSNGETCAVSDSMEIRRC